MHPNFDVQYQFTSTFYGRFHRLLALHIMAIPAGCSVFKEGIQNNVERFLAKNPLPSNEINEFCELV